MQIWISHGWPMRLGCMVTGSWDICCLRLECYSLRDTRMLGVVKYSWFCLLKWFKKFKFSYGIWCISNCLRILLSVNNVGFSIFLFLYHIHLLFFIAVQQLQFISNTTSWGRLHKSFFSIQLGFDSHFFVRCKDCKIFYYFLQCNFRSFSFSNDANNSIFTW